MNTCINGIILLDSYDYFKVEIQKCGQILCAHHLCLLMLGCMHQLRIVLVDFDWLLCTTANQCGAGIKVITQHTTYLTDHMRCLKDQCQPPAAHHVANDIQHQLVNRFITSD